MNIYSINQSIEWLNHQTPFSLIFCQRNCLFIRPHGRPENKWDYNHKIVSRKRQQDLSLLLPSFDLLVDWGNCSLHPYFLGQTIHWLLDWSLLSARFSPPLSRCRFCLRPKKFKCYVFSKVSKKNYVSKFLIEPFWIAAPKRPFARTKILEESTPLVLNFCNGQKLFQTSQCQWKISKNNISHAMCVRHPYPRSDTTPPKKRRAALNHTVMSYQQLAGFCFWNVVFSRGLHCEFNTLLNFWLASFDGLRNNNVWFILHKEVFNAVYSTDTITVHCITVLSRCHCLLVCGSLHCLLVYTSLVDSTA